MDAIPFNSIGLKPGDGLGDFIRFTSDGQAAERGPAPTPDGFTQWPAREPAIRRLSRIGMFRRTAGRGLRRLL